MFRCTCVEEIKNVNAYFWSVSHRIDDALNYIKLSVKYAIERESRPN